MEEPCRAIRIRRVAIRRPADTRADPWGDLDRRWTERLRFACRLEKHIRVFKDRASKMSARWGTGPEGRTRCYHRHLDNLSFRLNREMQHHNHASKNILGNALRTLKHDAGRQ